MTEVTPGEAFAAGGMAAIQAMAGVGVIVTHAPGREPGEDGTATAEEIEALGKSGERPDNRLVRGVCGPTIDDDGPVWAWDWG